MNQGKRSTAPEAEAAVKESAKTAAEDPGKQAEGTASDSAKQAAPDSNQPTDEELVAQDEFAELQKQLEEASSKADENWDQFLRARADLENVRRRAERDLANAHKFGVEKFAKDILPVKDSLEMGIAAAAEDGADPAKLLEGSELTLKMLATALSKYGIEAIDPKGEKFNPEQHEAMAMQPSSEAEPNTVLQVIQKGYLLNDRVLRPAMVIVASAG